MKTIGMLCLGVCVLMPSVGYAQELSGPFGHERVHLHEVGIGVGYAWGDLQQDQGNFTVFPIFLHFGWDINSLVGLEDHAGTLQAALEPFGNAIRDPEGGVEIGVDVFFKYAYPMNEKWMVYAEAGGGPVYFSIDTIEQGDAGINFLDQVGGGIQYRMGRDKSLNLGYRWRHLSNAGLDDQNAGIDAHSVVVGLSAFY